MRILLQTSWRLNVCTYVGCRQHLTTRNRPTDAYYHHYADVIALVNLFRRKLFFSVCLHFSLCSVLDMLPRKASSSSVFGGRSTSNKMSIYHYDYNYPSICKLIVVSFTKETVDSFSVSLPACHVGRYYITNEYLPIYHFDFLFSFFCIKHDHYYYYGIM